MRVAIIGAGLAGLTAARTLKAEGGVVPVVYDKGRGLGGRMATRRADGGAQFDHGAQYLSPEDAEFAALLDEAEAAGAAGRWRLEDGRERIVGRPGMSGIARHLALGLEIRQGVEIPSLGRADGGWSVAGEAYDRVICTVPAPQAMRLLDPRLSAVDGLRRVAMEPCLTLMLALPPGSPRPFVTRHDPEDAIAWIARDSAKRGDAGPDCWVAQAGPAWSAANLEGTKDDIARTLVPLLCARIGADPDAALHVAGHRWRYARASAVLGAPFLVEAGTLFMGGDWALSARAEGAWRSGRSMARAVLDTR